MIASRTSTQRGRTVASTAVFILAVAALLVGTASASAKTKFVSKRYGYSLVLRGAAAGWVASRAAIAWSGDPPDPDNPGFDTYSDVKHSYGRVYLVAALRLPAGTTLQTWTNQVIGITPGGCSVLPSVSTSKLRGAAASVFSIKCAAHQHVALELAAIHAHRGYLFIVLSPSRLSRASDRRAFNAARRSFRFGGKHR